MLLLLPSLRAAIIDFTDTQNVNSAGLTNFTFSQFDPSLGTLTAIDLLLTSSTPSGNITVTNNSDTNTSTVTGIQSALNILGGTGHSGYSGSSTALNTSPGSTFYAIAASGSQLFTMNPGQSLIGGVTQTIPISSGSFASYTGLGTVSFSGYATVNINTFGASYTADSTNYFSATSATLRYTYSGTAAVPEPGQIAASLVALAAIGTFVLRRRFTKKTSA